MTSRNRNRSRALKFAAAAALMAVVGLGESALAQTKSQQPHPDNSRPLHGVRSKGPRIRHPQTGGGLPINRRNTLLPQRPRSVDRDRDVDRPRQVVRPIRRDRDGSVIITRPDGQTIRRPAGSGGVIIRGGRDRGVISDGAVVRIGSGGISAGGVFTDSDSSVAFHVGSGLHTHQPHFGKPRRHHGHHGHHHGHSHIGFPHLLWDWWDDDDYAPTIYYAGYADPYVTTGQTYAQQIAAQQAAQLAQPPQLTELEQADLALALGDAEDAVNRYKAYADTHEESAEVVRSLALALFEAGRVDEAVATMALAYEKDPTLASRPVSEGALAGDNADMLERVRRAVRHAHKVKTSSAWLTVAVLMQAQERDRVALTMAQRARDAGMSEPIYHQFRSALGG